MWPKAFAQFIELAPHISRLLPMADRFFESKTTADDSNRKAIEAMGEGLRADLNRITVNHAGLSEQISDLSRDLQRVAADSAAAKLAAEAVEQRLTRLEARQSRVFLLLSILLVIVSAICILVAIVLAHLR